MTVADLFGKLDSTTYNHSIRVMQIADEIEESLSIPNQKLSEAALLHDIGKIYIAPVILDKTGKLSGCEREIMDLHPYIGYRILHGLDVDEDICRIVLYHHGMKPLEISPVEPYYNDFVEDKALMLHTIDVFEALTSDRPYHRGLPAIDAVEIMSNSEGFHEDVIRYIYAIAENSSYINSAVRRRYHVELSNTVVYILDHLDKRHSLSGIQ